MDLTITDGDAAGSRLLTLSGSLDLASRDQLVTRGTAALAEAGTARLVLDLAAVDFIDSTGLGAIVTVANAAEDQSAEFALRAPSARVIRILTVSGLLDAWPITD